MDNHQAEDHAETSHHDPDLVTVNGSGGTLPGVNSVNSLPIQSLHPPESEIANGPQNLFRMAVSQILFRIGWIFKTESVIMPAFLDLIGGSGFLRGCLPMLNRFGQSIPPLLLSEHVANLPRKKFAMFATTMLMGICFLTLSAVWFFTDGKWSAMPVFFLVIYALFFTATGINQLLSNTLVGKLITVRSRGRLAAISSFVGGLMAVAAAWLLLRGWLTDSSGRFDLIFGFTGLLFVTGGVVALFFIEPEDTVVKDIQAPWPLIRSSLGMVVGDRNFRLLMIVAAMFGMSMTLTPHYQTLARTRLDVGLTSLIPWVIAQHIGASMVSVPAGWLADRCGNRIVVQWLLFLLTLAPLTALGLSYLGTGGRMAFPLVFFMLGLLPITFRFLTNYTLETTDASNHPRYLSTLGLFLSAPVIATSVLFGWLADWLGFEFVFLLIWAGMVFGWLVSLRLDEPRHAD